MLSRALRRPQPQTAFPLFRKNAELWNINAMWSAGVKMTPGTRDCSRSCPICNGGRGDFLWRDRNCLRMSDYALRTQKLITERSSRSADDDILMSNDAIAPGRKTLQQNNPVLGENLRGNTLEPAMTSVAMNLTNNICEVSSFGYGPT